MTLRLLIAAGGTGGHVLPALAVAEAVRAERPDARIHFVGGRRGIEGTLVPRHGFPLTRLPASGLRGLGVAGALRFAVGFLLASLPTLTLLVKLRPQVCLATGGYASAAPAFLAALLGVPLWIQEQNSAPGSTNRVLGRRAERIYAAFETARDAFPRAKSFVVVPNPVRASIREAATAGPSGEDYARFDLDPRRPTLLVFGGSRGAHTLNRAFGEAWPRLQAETELQALVQTGEEESASTRAIVTRVSDDPSRVRVLPFIDDMDAAYRIADLVVSRAGAMTLAELAVVGRAAVLVPFPHATDDHQWHNAQELVAAGAAVAVRDEEFDGARMADEVTRLLSDEGRIDAMAAAARRWGGEVDGARRIARALIERAETGRLS